MKVQFFNRAEKTSSAHTAPKMSVGSSSKSTANEGNLSLFSCLRSRKLKTTGVLLCIPFIDTEVVPVE